MALDPISSIADLVGTVIDKVIPDADAAAKAKIAVLTLQQNGVLAQLTAQTDIIKGQLAVDQAEASSSDPFTSRARPFIIWVCGAALVWTFILAPAISYLTGLAGHPLPKLPAADDHLWELMGTLLGMGGWHAYENVATANAK